MERVLLFNIGWMRHYHGQTPSDRIINGGKYVAENENGGEVTNFRPLKGRCYAYARSPRGGKVNIDRLGAAPDAEHIDDVTVVFVATRPEGGSVVAGWYDRARVWRSEQTYGRRCYLAEAPAKRCVLLPVDQRVLRVPRARPGQWGIGQSNIRFADEPSARDFLRRLARFMENPLGFDDFEKPNRHRTRRGGGGAPRQIDPVLRAKVERAAIECVVAHYEGQGYECARVERENRGWDLEFTRGEVTLLVEVKGCSGEAHAVELTPNEYTAMCNAANHDTYRLAAVGHALLKRRARLTIIRFNGSDETWRDEDEREIKILKLTGARVQL
jgi:hypothetical protein